MKERPIIFNGEMIRAILDGRKTQTRRPVKPQPTEYGLVFRRAGVSEKLEDDFYAWEDDGLLLDEHSEDGGPCQRLCPFGVAGDRLWCRETWMAETEQSIPTGGVIYRATDKPEPDENSPLCWRPSIHMPREASRITLEITSVRIERLQEITEEDAKAEGIDMDIPLMPHVPGMGATHPSAVFSDLWDSIYAKCGFGWDSNPYVWVIEFRRVEQ